MKKFIFILSLFSILSANAQQQTFSKVYYNGVDYIQAYDLFRSADNHYYIAGTDFITKTDSSGNIVWTKQYTSGAQPKFNCIIPDPDGNPVVAGYANDGDALIMKTDQNGDTIWAKYIDFGLYSEAFTVSLVHDSGFVLCGYTYGSATPNQMFVVRTDKNGNLIWSKTYTIGNNTNYSYSVKETADSGFIVAAYAVNYPPVASYAVALKLDENGNSEWCKGYSIGSDPAMATDVVSDGINLIFGCNFSNSYTLVKTDSAGNLMWAKDQLVQTDNVVNIPPTRLRKAKGGGFAILTSVYMSWYWEQNLIVCDSAGNQLSANDIDMYGSSVVEADDSGFMVLGNGPLMGVKNNEKNIIESQFVIVKTDSTGNSQDCNTPKTAGANTIYPTTYFLSAASLSEGAMNNISFVISDLNLLIANECVGYWGGFEEKSVLSFSVYPNPSNGAFSLQFDNAQQNADVTVRVYNAQGDCVCSTSERMHDEVLLELNGLNSGLYYIVVSTGSETMSKVVEIQR